MEGTGQGSGELCADFGTSEGVAQVIRATDHGMMRSSLALLVLVDSSPLRKPAPNI